MTSAEIAEKLEAIAADRSLTLSERQYIDLGEAAGRLMEMEEALKPFARMGDLVWALRKQYPALSFSSIADDFERAAQALCQSAPSANNSKAEASQ